jgi:hypothetical protein
MPERSLLTLKAASAFGELRGSVEPSHAGLWARERRLQMVTVMTHNGRRAELSARLTGRYGFPLPDGPRRIANGAAAILG